MSIPCPGCGAALEVHHLRCACGRFVTREDRDALESRFEATNADYAEAKGVAVRALAVALVAGIFTLFLGVMRRVAAMRSEVPVDDMSAFVGSLDMAGGVALVLTWWAGKREPLLALGLATIEWLLVAWWPFVFAPAEALLGVVSPVGVAVTLARIGVLLVLLRGVAAAARQRRLLPPL